MSNPRPESRIKSLEQRATDIEADIVELSNDTAEELRAIRQDIKQLNDGTRPSFMQIGDTLIAIEESLETTKAIMATKEDLKILATKAEMIAMENRINSNITVMKDSLLDAIKQLQQQKPSDEQEQP